MHFKLFIILIFSFFLMGCPSTLPVPIPNPADSESTYADVEDRGTIENKELDEASGLVASRKNPGFLWAHNDSGDSNRIFLFDNTGKGKREFMIQGAQNRDWEDIAIVGEADGSATIYLADFGDNLNQHPNYTIYWFKEPTVDVNTPQYNTITQVNKVTFTLSDGPHDLECLLIDQKSKDVFMVSKRDNTKQLYQILAANMVPGGNTKAEYIQKLENFSQPFSTDIKVIQAFYITAGDVSPDNSEIIIKNYFEIYYWKRKTGETLPQALARQAKTVPYAGEPQGEGLAFAADGKGYYTISEGVGVKLYFYKKK